MRDALRLERPPPERPVVIYDGECGFCRRWVARAKPKLRGRIDFLPSQAAGDPFPEIPREALAEAVQLIDTDGSVKKGAAAILRAMSARPTGKAGWWCYRHVPGVAPVAERMYRFVAGHRRFFSSAVGWISGPHEEPPGNRVTRWFFLRGLAAIYLIAFASFWYQADGLIGRGGILPVGVTMERVEGNLKQQEISGWGSFLQFPTVFWAGEGDGMVTAVCAAGVVISLVALTGVVEPLCFLWLWLLYLSLCSVGGIFMGYQWDILLLETGFLAIFFGSWEFRPRLFGGSEPSPWIRFLLRWLLFRLMLGSGLVKIASGDESWWPKMSAMSVHYETQPIPTWTAWLVHQLPEAFHRFTTGLTLLAELIVPFLIFGPRRIRFVGAAVVIGLQFIILSTGNYTFFNWLTIVLCLPLLDDGCFRRRWRDEALSTPSGLRWLLRARRPVVAVVAAAILPVSFFMFWGQVDRFHARFGGEGDYRMPVWAGAIADAVSPFRSVSTYGLFAVMTTSRPQIIMQGSLDGKEWTDYEFKHKPGRLDRRPRFVAPHQPRLDWQMWFAALRSAQNPATQAWFVPFAFRLHEGSPAVLRLLAFNPFPEGPPTYIRAIVYDYRFTDRQTRRDTGQWWQRSDARIYCPAEPLRRIFEDRMSPRPADPEPTP